MSIAVSCVCGQKFKAPDAAAGKKLKCPKCSAPLTIPPLPTDPLAVDLPESTGALDPFGDDVFGDASQFGGQNFPAQAGFPPAAMPPGGFTPGAPYPVTTPAGSTPAGRAKNTRIIIAAAVGGGLLLVVLVAVAGIFLTSSGGADVAQADPVSEVPPPVAPPAPKPEPVEPASPQPVEEPAPVEKKDVKESGDGGDSKTPDKKPPGKASQPPVKTPELLTLPPVKLAPQVQLSGGATVSPPSEFVAQQVEKFGAKDRWMELRRWKHPTEEVVFSAAVVRARSFQSSLLPRVSARHVKKQGNVYFGELDMWIVPGALTREEYVDGRWRTLASRRTSQQIPGAAALAASYAAGQLYAVFFETAAPVTDELFASLQAAVVSLNVETASSAQPPSGLVLNEKVLRTQELTASAVQQATDTEEPVVPDGDTIASLAISDDGFLAVYGDVKGDVHKFRTGETGVSRSWKVVEGGSATFLSIAADNRTALVGARSLKNFIALNLGNGNHIRQYYGSTMLSGRVFQSHFYAAKKGKITVYYDWLAVGKEKETHLPANTRQTVLSDDETKIAFITESGSVGLWEPDMNRKKLNIFKPENLHGAGNGTAIAFSADGSQLLSADLNGLLVLWDVSGGKVVRQWKSLGQINAVSFLDGGEAIVQHADSLSQISLNSDQIKLIKKFNQPISLAAFSRDRKHGVFARSGGKSRQDILHWERDK